MLAAFLAGLCPLRGSAEIFVGAGYRSRWTIAPTPKPNVSLQIPLVVICMKSRGIDIRKIGWCLCWDMEMLVKRMG